MGWVGEIHLARGLGEWEMGMGEEKKKKLGRGCWEQSEPLRSFDCKCN